MNKKLLLWTSVFIISLAFMLGGVSATTYNTNVTNGLTAWYPLDVNANDIVGGNNGQVFGIVTWHNNSLSLDGTNAGYIEVNDSTAIDFYTNNFTISLWVNVNNPGLSTILDKFETFGINRWKIWSLSGLIKFGKNSPGNINVTSTYSNWQHIIFERSGDDGIVCNNSMCLTSQGIFTGVNFNQELKMTIGRTYDGSNYMNGSLSGVRFYNRSLSQDEITNLYSEGRYDFNFPIFSNSTDNNGTLINSGNGTFNVTVNQTNGTVILNIDNTNTTATQLTIQGTSVTDGLTAWYPLDGNANDIVGGNNGTVVGVVDWSNYALNLNGTNGNYIDVTHTSAIDFGTNNFTISFWINTSDYVGDKKILYKWSGGNPDWIVKNKDGLLFFYKGGGITENASLKLNITKNSMQLITVGRNGTQGFICNDSSNCIYANLFSASESMNVNDNLKIGCSSSGLTCITGALSGLRFYSRTLSQEEINTIYTEGRIATIPLTTPTGIVYHAQHTFTSPGNYPYYWSSYGSGVYANYNQSDVGMYTIILSNPITGSSDMLTNSILSVLLGVLGLLAISVCVLVVFKFVNDSESEKPINMQQMMKYLLAAFIAIILVIILIGYIASIM